jgi:hypothetical protein
MPLKGICEAKQNLIFARYSAYLHVIPQATFLNATNHESRKQLTPTSQVTS